VGTADVNAVCFAPLPDGRWLFFLPVTPFQTPFAFISAFARVDLRRASLARVSRG
jgi:hypothetical protein